MEVRTGIALLAHGAGDHQVALSVSTNNVLGWRISQLVICANLLPLVDAFVAEDVLAL